MRWEASSAGAQVCLFKWSTPNGLKMYSYVKMFNKFTTQSLKKTVGVLTRYICTQLITNCELQIFEQSQDGGTLIFSSFPAQYIIELFVLATYITN